jgi:hypothetical protein
MRRWNRLTDAHWKALVKQFGKERAERANIGWSQGDDSICTKVYPHKKGEYVEYLSTYFEGRRIVSSATMS